MEDAMSYTTALETAAADLSAEEQPDGSWRFRDDHGQMIEVDAADLARYGAALLAGTADYSVWCSETTYETVAPIIGAL